MIASQELAPVEVLCSLGKGTWQLRDLTWREQLGRPFEGQLTILSTDASIDLAKQLKSPVAIRIDIPNGGSSWLHGYVGRLENLGPEMRLTRYRATLVSCIGLLKHSGGCRIFQNQSAIDIVRKIFADRGLATTLETRLNRQYPKREYCVQYAESDFNFVTRLLEEEGIYYFFTYSKDKHALILADDVHAHRTANGNEAIEYRTGPGTRLDEYLTNFSAGSQFGTGGVELNDYDFQKPRAKLQAQQLSASADKDWRWYHHPGRYIATDRGQQLARTRQEAFDAAAAWATLEGTPRSVRCGDVFKLKNHPLAARNQEYLVTGSTCDITVAGQHSGESSSFNFEVSLTVQPSKVPFRSSRSYERPSVNGPQVATVCGKAGEEIWTDNYGRIKVQFPWDRDGKSDDHSSCWIRVAQAWTGKNWGAMSVPRIGEEVVVEFLDGDPDQPIVVGRVYNADQMPPDALAAAQAKTIFRTRSTKGGDATTFHELSFDDTKDKELIYLHSERDMKRVIENDDHTTVGFEKKSPGDQTLDVYHDQTVTIGKGSGSGSQKMIVEKDRTITIAQGNDTLTVTKGNLTIKVSAGDTLVESAKSIVLKCGNSTISMKPAEIKINSPSISICADGPFKAQGANSTIIASGKLSMQGGIGALTASGPLTVKGAIVQIN